MLLLFPWNCEMPFKNSHVESKFLQMNCKLAELFPTLTPIFASGLVLCFILKHSFTQPTLSSLELDSSSKSGTTAISDGINCLWT